MINDNEIEMGLLNSTKLDLTEDDDTESLTEDSTDAESSISNSKNSKKKIAAISTAVVTVSALGALGIYGAVTRFGSSKKSKHPESSPTPTSTLLPTSSVTMTPSVTSSISPSFSVSTTPSSSMTPSVSTSKTPSSSRTPSSSLTPSRTPSKSASPSRTPSSSASVTPSVSISPIPDVSYLATYNFSLDLHSSIHSIWITNNHPDLPLIISSISLQVNSLTLPRAGALIQNSAVSCQSISDQLSYLCTMKPSSRTLIASGQSGRLDYSPISSIYRIAMNPIAVKVNNQTINIDAPIPFNEQTASTVQPAIRYAAWETQNGSAIDMPYSQLRKVFYEGALYINLQNVNSSSALYLPAQVEMQAQLPVMAFNKIKYQGAIETFLSMAVFDLDDWRNQDSCNYENYYLNSMNSTVQAQLIQLTVNVTKVWQVTGVNMDIIRPCAPGTGFPPFLAQLKTALIAADKKLSLHLPGDLNYAQQLSPDVVCAMADSADYVVVATVYSNETHSTFISPLNKVEESINYYKNLNCIPSSKLGFFIPTKAYTWMVASLEHNGYGQVVTSIPRGQNDLSPEEIAYFNVTEDEINNAGLVNWRCIVGATTEACDDYNPVPADAVFIPGTQNPNGQAAWAYSPTSVNGSYWVMSYLDPQSAMVSANFAIQHNLGIVEVGPYAADVLNGSQSIFQNVRAAVLNQSNTTYAEKYFSNDTQQDFPMVIPANLVKTIDTILADLPEVAINAIKQGAFAFLVHKISRDEFTKMLMSYGCSKETIDWMNYALSQTLSFAMVWYYTGDFVSAMKSTLTFASANLYLQHIVGLSATNANVVITGANLGVHAVNSLPKAANVVIGAVGAALGQFAVSTGYDVYTKAVNVANTATSRFFKAAQGYCKNVMAEQATKTSAPICKV